MTGGTGLMCALPGCHKPPWPSVRQADAQALACGNLHHQLLMASRFNPALPSPYQAIVDRNAAELCALLSCRKAPFLGHSWCSTKHYLSWLMEFTSSLQPHQICKLSSCTRHVFVDDNALPSQFCGWRHEQKFVMHSALQHRQQEQLPPVEVSPQPSSASLDESEPVCGVSVSSLMLSLKHYAHSRIAPEKIRVVEDFYEKHPWEVFTVEECFCWLIARLEFTRKGRNLTTKGHYHWKQTGSRTKRSKYARKYYTYAKRKGKEMEAYQQHAESSFTMTEYTMEDVKRYALVRLMKEKATIDGKLGKKKPTKHQIAEQVHIACSPDTVVSKPSFSNNDLSEDSVFGDLSSLGVCTSSVS